jgi:flagellar assembly factor FliW
MQIRHKRFGKIDTEDQQVVRFPEGLVGFEGHREFILHRSETCEPFAWLISVDDPELVFAVADPEYFVTDSYVLRDRSRGHGQSKGASHHQYAHPNRETDSPL